MERCEHCGKLLDLSDTDNWVLLDGRAPQKVFCGYKCCGRWIIEIYETGKQFEYELEVENG